MYRVPEVHRVKHGAVRIFDVDAVMEHHAPVILGRFSECDADVSDGKRSRCVQVGKVDTLLVGHVDVVVQMKIEPWHVVKALKSSARSAL